MADTDPFASEPSPFSPEECSGIPSEHAEQPDKGAFRQNADPVVLCIRNLRKERLQGRGEAYSLRVPRLDLAPGEKLLITGPSGSGKSTLLDMLGMVLRPDAVERFHFHPNAREKAPEGAHDIARAWERGLVESLACWRRQVGYVLQIGGLLPFISVKENILAPRKLLGLAPDTLPDMLAEELGISALLRKFPSELSVGERQRVAIARALAANPALVLADEPTAALDPANAQNVLRLFSNMVEKLGATLILVSHAPEQTRGMNFRALTVRSQRVEQAGVTGTLAVLDDDGAYREAPAL